MPVCRVDGRENIVVVEQKVRVPDDLRGENDGSALRSSSRARPVSPRGGSSRSLRSSEYILRPAKALESPVLPAPRNLARAAIGGQESVSLTLMSWK